MTGLRHLGGKALAACGLSAAALLSAPYGVVLADKAEDALAKTAKAMFDPDALERGAKALREINKSTHAKQVGAIAAASLCR